MAIDTFLAMTAAEMATAENIPRHMAWMACHFSPYGTGLTNLPASLPPDSLLILNDRTPIHGHDPHQIAQQLEDCITQLQCRGVLLDFQRPNCEETRELVRYLLCALPCPVGVSEAYAQHGNHPVFLPPVPPSTPLEDYLVPWQEQEIWLELALDGEVLTLTEQGCAILPLPYPDANNPGFVDEKLHCHYRAEIKESAVRFSLWRTTEDLKELEADAKKSGVTTAVGLYQELVERGHDPAGQ